MAGKGRLRATLGTAVGFWKTVSEVSPRVIADEISRPFKLALVGEADDRRRLQEALLTSAATPAQRLEAEDRFRHLEAPPDADTAAAFTFTLYVAGEGEPIGVRGSNAVPFQGDLDEVIAWIIEAKPTLALAMARRFPRFRIPVCQFLIRETSRVNAQVALLSALPGVVPGWLAPLLPVSSAADVLLLTKNQAMLVMRLAAAYGHRPGYTRQVKELLGVIGTALGWRTLAREVVGYIPVAGVAIKPVIAYSGTMAAGKAALWYYIRGSLPSKEQVRAFEQESEAEAREAVKTLRTSESPAQESDPPA